MTSKRRENINLVSFICLSFLISRSPELKKNIWNMEFVDLLDGHNQQQL